MSQQPDELDIPATLAEAGEDFLHVVRLCNLVASDYWGSDDFAISPAAFLELSRSSIYEERHVLGVRADAGIVACARIELPLKDNTHLGYVQVQVDPGHTRRGAGSALLEQAVALIRSHGRDIASGWSDHRLPAPGSAVLTAATGTGAVAADEAAAAFARHHGFALEQVERMSVLEAPFAAPAPARDGQRDGQPDGQSVADGYELLPWESPCPAELVDDYAQLRRRMSIDVPVGELDLREEAWDPARVRADEAQTAAKNERTLVTAVRHIASGRLVGHSILESALDKPDVAFQGDTLVLSAHRGHGLGLVLKRHNLRRTVAAWPGCRRIYTFNAAENVHMLAINEALGFRAVGATGLWQKRLDRG